MVTKSPDQVSLKISVIINPAVLNSCSRRAPLSGQRCPASSLCPPGLEDHEAAS